VLKYKRKAKSIGKMHKDAQDWILQVFVNHEKDLKFESHLTLSYFDSAPHYLKTNVLSGREE
jgi:hypothetical protein